MAKNLFRNSDSTSKYRLKPFGYTLIELLITILIMTILFGVGFANYRGFQQRKQLDTIVEMIKSDLSYTRQNILAGRKTGTNCGDSSRILISWEFRNTSVAPAYNYEIRVNCSDGLGLYWDTVKSADIAALAATLSMSSSSLLFYPIGKGTN